MYSLIKKIFFKELLSTKDGLYQLNPNYKKKFYSGGTFKRIDEFNDDFIELVQKNRLGTRTEYSYKSSCRVIARYARIERVGEKDDVFHRSDSLQLCNGISNGSLGEWINIYNQYNGNVKQINNVIQALDGLYEAEAYREGGTSKFDAIEDFLSSLEKDGKHNDFLDLFKFKKDVNAYGRAYMREEVDALKVYISVFIQMHLDLPMRASCSTNYVGYTSRVHTLLDDLIEYQVKVLENISGRYKDDNIGVNRLVSQYNYVY